MARSKTNQDRVRIYRLYFFVIIVLCCLGVVAWLAVTPKDPKFRIMNVQLPTRLNTTLANNTLVVDLQIFNPNKNMEIYYYDRIGLVLYKADGGNVMGTNSTPGFCQRRKETTVVQLNVHANSREFWQGSRGVVDFVIRVETAVKFKIVKWKTKMKKIEFEASFRNISLSGTVGSGNFTRQHNMTNTKV